MRTEQSKNRLLTERSSTVISLPETVLLSRPKAVMLNITSYPPNSAEACTVKMGKKRHI